MVLAVFPDNEFPGLCFTKGGPREKEEEEERMRGRKEERKAQDKA